MDIDVTEELGSGSSHDTHRMHWTRQRLEQESRHARFRSSLRPKRILQHALRLAGSAFQPPFMGPFMGPLTKSAYSPRLTERELGFSHLPAAFDGYRVLHLSDFHFDRLPGIEHVIADLTRGLDLDLAVFTGDYQDRRARKAPHLEEAVLRPLRTICAAIDARDGVLATLGNHDSVRMVSPLESMGLRVLCNETVPIHRSGHSIYVTGLDDVCRYYTLGARDALRKGRQGFKIALVHSADLYEEAADNGYALQLSGHTHGGQICLPGGVPIFTNSRAGRRFASGMWQHGQLRGITNRGVGASGVPLRAFCPGEVLVITLRCQGSGVGVSKSLPTHDAPSR
jgi:predicted MPP superfamily phosphohydrolase